MSAGTVADVVGVATIWRFSTAPMVSGKSSAKLNFSIFNSPRSLHSSIPVEGDEIGEDAALREMLSDWWSGLGSAVGVFLGLHRLKAETGVRSSLAPLAIVIAAHFYRHAQLRRPSLNERASLPTSSRRS